MFGSLCSPMRTTPDFSRLVMNILSLLSLGANNASREIASGGVLFLYYFELRMTSFLN